MQPLRGVENLNCTVNYYGSTSLEKEMVAGYAVLSLGSLALGKGLSSPTISNRFTIFGKFCGGAAALGAVSFYLLGLILKIKVVINNLIQIFNADDFKDLPEIKKISIPGMDPVYSISYLKNGEGHLEFCRGPLVVKERLKLCGFEALLENEDGL
ncbi:MAG: hypothetical protein S4CHLAM45_11640 [Chlamydiales bacterium]|nr:hypothetical protein [Chlamydiales bacterium]MCH9619656.1 hypothetical protein [Chlamydiales bacterium]MCH9623262.1 hypothetical protein [Chlamydiales bacterium]